MPCARQIDIAEYNYAEAHFRNQDAVSEIEMQGLGLVRRLKLHS